MDMDILKSPQHHIIIQQVNCQGVMGKGLAKQIAETYPFVKKQYVDFCQGKLPEDLFGNCLLCSSSGSLRKVVCNFSRLGYGYGKVHTEYEAVRECFKTIAEYFNPEVDKFAIPYKYGCGLGNGDWAKVSKIIEQELKGFEFVFYKI